MESIGSPDTETFEEPDAAAPPPAPAGAPPRFLEAFVRIAARILPRTRPKIIPFKTHPTEMTKF